MDADPVTIGAGLLGARGLTQVIGRVVGPAADEVAAALARYTEYRLRNVGRVTENAARKTQQDTGTVPMRVAMRVFEEGSYSDDDVVVEYLGGVLASSRTELGRDDRGNTYTALVARLSTYHLRSHFIWYSEFRRLLRGRNINVYDGSQLHQQALMFMPYVVYDAAMDYGPGEHAGRLFSHSVYALQRESLIELVRAGNVDHLRKAHAGVTDPGMVIRPTVAGCELFLWAHGLGQLEAKDFTSEDLDLQPFEGVTIEPAAQLVNDMNGR